MLFAGGEARNFPYVAAGLAIWTVWLIVWHATTLWRAAKVASAPPARYGFQLALAFAGYGLLFIGNPRIRHPLWLLPPWLGWAMVALIAVAFIFSLWARIRLGALWSGGVTLREGHRVVREGPYALVRHPIYTGLIAGALAFAALKATPFALAGAALVAIGFALKARIEENFLAEALGRDEYDAYRRSVPMLVPLARFRRSG
jgi:protein-S-isoprenylcysteine O-methyltransferase Ste14